jgi:ubiquinone/menaquinone biosynthesis C-methylase UbiE/uncharacterized protein YbaR (Trm112 family)
VRSSSLALLGCPACRQDLRLEAAGAGPGIKAGKLRCLGCSKVYPIQKGIPRFAARQELVGQNKLAYWVQTLDAPVYDQTVKLMTLLFGIREDEGRREYLSRLELRQEAKILEVAVGPGPNFRYIRQMSEAIECYGLDLSTGMLRQCGNNLQKWGLEAELFQGLAEQLPVKDNTFDVVFSVGGINNFRDKRAAIAEMVRVAKPGTKIVIVDEWFHPQRTTGLLRRVLKLFPSFSQRTAPPVDLVPADIEDLKVVPIWNGYGYCLELRRSGGRQSRPGGGAGR